MYEITDKERRRVALKLAVESAANNAHHTSNSIITRAEKFEAYLKGTDSDG